MKLEEKLREQFLAVIEPLPLETVKLRLRMITRIAIKAVAAEREACAEVAEELAEFGDGTARRFAVSHQIASVIRARSEGVDDG